MSNSSPLVGIVCIDVSRKLSEHWPKTKSYIARSYARFVEDQGACCVPIWINQPESYYRNLLRNINGVLIPGGALNYNSKDNSKDHKDTNYSVTTINIILRLACEMFDTGIYFPVWGTCLGFQMMLNHSAGERDIREKRCQLNDSMPLELKDDFLNSKMFGHLPKDMEKYLQEEPFAYHYHHFYITQAKLDSLGIADQWTVTGVNHDDEGFEFISTIEHKKYPLYGVQFHPEKTIYEVCPPNVSDSEISKTCANYFAKFFILECRKNSNHFEDENELQRHIISKFPITITEGTPWSQCYLFTETND